MKSYSLRTKENSRRNSRNRQIARICVGIVFAAVLLWFLSSAVGKTVSFVTMPIYMVREWFVNSSATIPVYFQSRNELIDEIQDLKIQLSAQSGNTSVNKQLSAENESLRNLLNITDIDRQGARIIGMPPQVPYDQLYIDRGSIDGIDEGAYVYVAEHHAIGFVSKVFPHSALVQLFSTPGLRSTVYIDGPDIYTFATGIGGGVIEIAVPQGITIEEGNVVVLPLMERSIVGTVSSIESIPTEPEQRAYVTPDISLYALTHVAVSNRQVQTIPFSEAQSYMRDMVAELIVDVPAEILVEVGSSTASTTEASQTVEEN